MANGHVDEVRRQLCRLFAAGSASGLGDGELVQRLVDRGSEAAGSAFETILTRHGSVESHARAEVPLRCATNSHSCAPRRPSRNWRDFTGEARVEQSGDDRRQAEFAVCRHDSLACDQRCCHRNDRAHRAAGGSAIESCPLPWRRRQVRGPPPRAPCLSPACAREITARNARIPWRLWASPGYSLA
jgi:hypothetical protein